MTQTFPWAPGQDFPVPPAQSGVTAANLEFLGRQAQQTFDAIMRRVNDCCADHASMVSEVSARLDSCRNGIASILQSAVSLQQLDTPALRRQALMERGAPDTARAVACAEVARHCVALASATDKLLRVLDAGEDPAASGVDMLAPTILLGGSSAMSFMLSIAANVPVDVPYVEWFARSTEAMLAVMTCDVNADAMQGGGDARLRQCLPHARALSACCSALRRACESVATAPDMQPPAMAASE
ncbi:hypothetical protein L602_000700001050 [Cupriavidus gilardii J11]|uniref:Uncharacterized protein n=1 Tax=Cupriavidus gilardii J11 TaxID=936133 RepID=A0A562B2L9_9BURK|nr:hypothetical protein [Cupriavidus gilardii]TWG79289.1 hypothetical protein L602_000700001050 [Cupriavidus gilardii J11]